MTGPCHTRIYEHPRQSKMRTDAFIEAVRRQAVKLRNIITSSEVKIAGKITGSYQTILKTLN